jgi:hypothetical protein
MLGVVARIPEPLIERENAPDTASRLVHRGERAAARCLAWAPMSSTYHRSRLLGTRATEGWTPVIRVVRSWVTAGSANRPW